MRAFAQLSAPGLIMNEQHMIPRIPADCLFTSPHFTWGSEKARTMAGLR